MKATTRDGAAAVHAGKELVEVKVATAVPAAREMRGNGLTAIS